MLPLPATLLSPGAVCNRKAVPPSRPGLMMVARPGALPCSLNPQSVGEFGDMQWNCTATTPPASGDFASGMRSAVDVRLQAATTRKPIARIALLRRPPGRSPDSDNDKAGCPLEEPQHGFAPVDRLPDPVVANGMKHHQSMDEASSIRKSILEGFRSNREVKLFQ